MLQRRTNDLLDVLSTSQAKHTLVNISSLMQRWAHDVTVSFIVPAALSITDHNVRAS